MLASRMLGGAGRAARRPRAVLASGRRSVLPNLTFSGRAAGFRRRPQHGKLQQLLRKRARPASLHQRQAHWPAAAVRAFSSRQQDRGGDDDAASNLRDASVPLSEAKRGPTQTHTPDSYVDAETAGGDKQDAAAEAEAGPGAGTGGEDQPFNWNDFPYIPHRNIHPEPIRTISKKAMARRLRTGRKVRRDRTLPSLEDRVQMLLVRAGPHAGLTRTGILEGLAEDSFELPRTRTVVTQALKQMRVRGLIRSLPPPSKAGGASATTAGGKKKPANKKKSDDAQKPSHRFALTKKGWQRIQYRYTVMSAPEAPDMSEWVAWNKERVAKMQEKVQRAARLRRGLPPAAAAEEAAPAAAEEEEEEEGSQQAAQN